MIPNFSETRKLIAILILEIQFESRVYSLFHKIRFKIIHIFEKLILNIKHIHNLVLLCAPSVQGKTFKHFL